MSPDSQRPRIPSRVALEKAAECLRTIGHPTRLKMLMLLDADAYNVGQVARSCGISSHLASEHLRLMERCGLLARHRVGKETFYRLAEPALHDIMSCVVNRFGSGGTRRRKS